MFCKLHYYFYQLYKKNEFPLSLFLNLSSIIKREDDFFLVESYLKNLDLSLDRSRIFKLIKYYIV